MEQFIKASMLYMHPEWREYFEEANLLLNNQISVIEEKIGELEHYIDSIIKESESVVKKD